jgi:hypothetical protein
MLCPFYGVFDAVAHVMPLRGVAAARPRECLPVHRLLRLLVFAALVTPTSTGPQIDAGQGTQNKHLAIADVTTVR